MAIKVLRRELDAAHASTLEMLRGEHASEIKAMEVLGGPS